MKKKDYNLLLGKYDISNPNEKETIIFTLSDLQILQPNLLYYEEKTRLILPKLKHNGQLLDKNSYEKLSYEEKIKKMIESNIFTINQYKKYILENIDNFNTFVDLGDFIFNISNEKLDMLYKYGLYEKLKEIFDILDKHNKYKILVIGNHDKVKYNEFYYNFFDKTTQHGNLFTKDGKIELYTHKPFIKYKWELDKKTDKPLKVENNKNLYDNLGVKIDKGYINSNDIINIHGHIHSRELVDCLIYPDIKYYNRCLDYLI